MNEASNTTFSLANDIVPLNGGLTRTAKDGTVWREADYQGGTITTKYGVVVRARPFACWVNDDNEVVMTANAAMTSIDVPPSSGQRKAGKLGLFPPMDKNHKPTGRAKNGGHIGRMKFVTEETYINALERDALSSSWEPRKRRYYVGKLKTRITEGAERFTLLEIADLLNTSTTDASKFLKRRGLLKGDHEPGQTFNANDVLSKVADSKNSEAFTFGFGLGGTLHGPVSRELIDAWQSDSEHEPIEGTTPQEPVLHVAA